MVMEDGGVTHFKLDRLFMYHFPTCCMSNAFLQHGRFDLLPENSWY